MNYFLKAIVFLLVSKSVIAQKTKKETYWEDQLYLNVTYNRATNLPEDIVKNRLSYGLGLGYLKDIPVTESGQIAFAIGAGYAYDQIYHGFDNSQNKTHLTSLNSYGNLTTHSFELPIQFRWRNSTIDKYAFWRIYLGVRFSYDFITKDNYKEFTNSNVNFINKYRKGITLSVGYNIVNLYINYNLDNLFKDTYYKNNLIETKVLKIGLIFYVL